MCICVFCFLQGLRDKSVIELEMFDKRIGRSVMRKYRQLSKLDRILDGEFDPGSERTLAACLTHASPVSYTHLTLPTKRIV